MGQRLTKMEISRVSLVDKGANKRAFAILKRDGSEDSPADDPMSGALELADTTPASVGGFLRGIADRITGTVEKGNATAIAKANTFASIIAGRELNDALPDAFYTLEDAIWAAIYAYDSNGADLPLADKQALVAQSLDEFKTYLVGIMASGIGKRDTSEGARAAARVEALVAKVGRKISAARLEQLKTAAGALSAVLADVEADPAEADVQKSGDAAEDDDMTNEDIQKAMAAALEPALKPFSERLDAIEKRFVAKPAEPVKKAETDETEGAGDGADEGAKDELTLAGVAEAMGQLADRFEVVEKIANRGQRTSGDGQDDDQVKKSQWAGMF